MALPTDIGPGLGMPPLAQPMQLQLPDVMAGLSSNVSDMQRESILRQPSTAVMSAADKLQFVQTVKVMEQRQLFEAITGVEENNVYIIADQEGVELFVVQEQSNCCERTCFCCCPDWKSYRMDFYDIPPEGLSAENWGTNWGRHFLHLERPCVMMCCCMCKPSATVTELDGKVIGKIREPRTRCSSVYSVQDNLGNGVLNSSGGGCQCGRFFRCPGFEVTFPIADVSDIRVAELRKQWTKGDCCPCFFQDWNQYMVEFGQAATAEAKLLLVSLALVVQMRHFDTR